MEVTIISSNTSFEVSSVYFTCTAEAKPPYMERDVFSAEDETCNGESFAMAFQFQHEI